MMKSKETATKRIKKEISDLAKENLGQITLTPNESNIFLWRASLPGPSGSPYEGGMFDVDIRIPQDYPFSPPQLVFLTKVYHCNIAHTGAICLDLLKTAWSPALSLYKVILSLSSLLTDPNPADPLVPAIAQEYKRNKNKHDATAKEWVKLYALPKKPPPAPTPTSAPAAASASRPAAPRMRSILRPETTSTPSSNSSTPGASSSSTPIPPAAPVAGVRRSRAQMSRSNGNGASAGANGVNGGSGSGAGGVVEVSDDEDVEVLGNGQANGSGSAGRGQGAHGNGTGAGPKRGPKRAKVAGNGAEGATATGSAAGTGPGTGDDDDVIVID